MLQNTKSKGFTLVELLIVIVVIAILAAISIVAYNGIQNRSKNTSAQSLASQVAKKAEAYNTINSAYPRTAAEFNHTDSPESNLEGINVQFTTGNPSSESVVHYTACPSTGTATGATIRWAHFGDTTAAEATRTIGTC